MRPGPSGRQSYRHLRTVLDRRVKKSGSRPLAEQPQGIDDLGLVAARCEIVPAAAEEDAFLLRTIERHLEIPAAAGRAQQIEPLCGNQGRRNRAVTQLSRAHDTGEIA